jgi:hypothetical protein
MTDTTAMSAPKPQFINQTILKQQEKSCKLSTQIQENKTPQNSTPKKQFYFLIFLCSQTHRVVKKNI